MNSSVLLIGGAGFIGERLSKRLLLEGYEVTVLDNLLRQVHGGSRPKFLGSEVRFIEADCSAWDWIRHPLVRNKSFRCIVLMAAETGTGQSAYEAQRYFRTNVESAAILNDLVVNSEVNLSQVRQSGSIPLGFPLSDSPLISTEKLILLSSRAVYGEGQLDAFGRPQPSHENDPTKPKSIYGASKLAQEALVLAGFPGVKKVVLRLQNVYGEGQSIVNPYTGVVVQFAKKALSSQIIPVYSDGKMTRDFIHVDDVVEVITRATTQELGDSTILNVGSGSSTTIESLAALIVSLAESKSQVMFTGSTFHGDVRNNFADITNLRNSGFEPQVSLPQGLSRLLNWLTESSAMLGVSRKNPSLG